MKKKEVNEVIQVGTEEIENRDRVRKEEKIEDIKRKAGANKSTDIEHPPSASKCAVLQASGSSWLGWPASRTRRGNEWGFTRARAGAPASRGTPPSPSMSKAKL